MAHLQYVPGDPRLVDQIVYELKSKGIFDQMRKDCIADVDTRPAYQNLRQRVETSVSSFLSRQCWQPDLNKNQLREKLRRHIHEGNYLDQGLERIVDQVVNPRVASVFIPQVEDLVYNYMGITRKKTAAETSNEKVENLLPKDLEAVSPGSVKSNDDDHGEMVLEASVTDETKMEIDELHVELKEESAAPVIVNEEKEKAEQITKSSSCKDIKVDSDKFNIPLPSGSIKVENIPSPDNSPPKVDVAKIELPKMSPKIPLPASIIASADIPLPDEIPKDVKDEYFKPINSDEDESSSDSSLRRNMSPLTPIRNFNNENSCDAQQAFENDLGNTKEKKQEEPSTFRFAIENKTPEKEDVAKIKKKETEQMNLPFQFSHQVNIHNLNTPLYEDSSNSNNLQIDYESDANSKANLEIKVNEEQSLEDNKKDRKVEEKKSSHKTSHRSRDSSKHSNSKDKRSDGKPSTSRDHNKHDKKSSKDDSRSKSSHKEKSSDKSDKKDSEKKERDSSKHRSSRKSSSHKDSKPYKSSSSGSSQRRSSKHSDEKKSSSSSNQKEKSEKSTEKISDKSSKDRSSKDSKSSSHRSDKDRKSSTSKSSSKHDEKDKDKKSKKENDDHYGLSGRGNVTRRSTDRDSNDGSSSSKGSHNPSSSKSSSSQKDSKGSSSKSDNTSPSGESTSPSDKEPVLKETEVSTTDAAQPKPIVRIDTRLEHPMTSPPQLPFVPDVTLKKPTFAVNLGESGKLTTPRTYMDEEQTRMNQEAALLLEFQANVRPSLSQVYSSIPGPELEFACVNNEQTPVLQNNPSTTDSVQQISNPTNALLAVVNAQNIEDINGIDSELSNTTEKGDSTELTNKSKNETCLPEGSEESKEDTKPESEETSLLSHSHEDVIEIHDVAEARVPDMGDEIDNTKESVELVNDKRTTLNEEHKGDNSCSVLTKKSEINQVDPEKEDNDKRTENFEITSIAEELSEREETQNSVVEKLKTANNFTNDSIVSSGDDVDEVPLDNNNTVTKKTKLARPPRVCPDVKNLKYFTKKEQQESELARDGFSKFIEGYIDKQSKEKIFLINCSSCVESVMRSVLDTLGNYDIVNYQRNGHLKLPKTNTIVKNVNVASEVSLPFDNNEFETAASGLEKDLKVTRPTYGLNVLSPAKSDCSIELSSEYVAKIDEMVKKASRQEVMEIIVGNVTSEGSPSKLPQIEYVTESNIETEEVVSLKRKLTEVETMVNNNGPVLTPQKMRKLSASDQITSTTEESEAPSSKNLQDNTRSIYLGKARRVGLPKPRKTDKPKSPSSDQSVENYEQNNKSAQLPPPTSNGKIKTPRRNKVQRYDTSDLYKPKLHYLSRRNNIN